MKKTMALAVLVPIMAACNDRPAERQDPGDAQSPSGSAPVASSLRAPTLKVKIDVKLKKNGSGVCVPEDPGRTTIAAGGTVRWKFKNQCQQGKKKQKIDPKNAPISGNCKNVTEVEDGQEKEGEECAVDPYAPVGVYKYKIDGDAVLDPELEIPPPPPPPQSEARPTSTPEVK